MAGASIFDCVCVCVCLLFLFMQAFIKVSVCREGKTTKKKGREQVRKCEERRTGNRKEGREYQSYRKQMTYNVQDFTLVTQPVA